MPLKDPEAHRAYSRAYYHAHRAERLECEKMYRDNHRESARTYNQTYSKKHKNEKRAQDAAYRKTHHEEILKRNREYYKNHREQIQAYREQHKDERKIYNQSYNSAHRDQNVLRRDSLEYRQHMSIVLKEAHTKPEFKEAQSSGLKEKWKDPNYRSHMISVMTSHEYKAKISGKNHPGWKGGISSWPYCPKFDKKLKEEIRTKFGRRCFISGKEENGKKHAVHHCDYLKSQGCQGQRWSLLPLDHSWHSKTNFNRWYWFALLRDYWVYKYLTFHGMDIFEGPDRTAWLWEMYNNGSN